MRSVLLVSVLFAACGDPAGGAYDPPDGAPSSCVGAFQIAAPVEGQHYVPDLVVMVDTIELQGATILTMTDDLGVSSPWTGWSASASPTDAGSWWNLERYTYVLAPGRRYVLTGSRCVSEPVTQTITFFTSS